MFTCEHYLIAFLFGHKTSKMTRRKLKILKFQNIKKKKIKIHVKKGTCPVSSLMKTSNKKIEDPQNEKEIENFKTSKYQIK